MGLTRVVIPDTGERVQESAFAIGDRVRMLNVNPKVEAKYKEGTVSHVPSVGAPIITLGSHRLGEEVSVELDGGGVAVTTPGNLERI
jgi:hypothetical protein